jgi:hypothetical protein
MDPVSAFVLVSIVGSCIGVNHWGMSGLRSGCKSPPPPPPQPKRRVLPEDYEEQINILFRKMQEEVEKFGDSSTPDFVVDRLCTRVMRAVEDFPMAEGAKIFVPDDFSERIAREFTETYLRATKNPTVNLNLVINYLHEDLMSLMKKWK